MQTRFDRFAVLAAAVLVSGALSACGSSSPGEVTGTGAFAITPLSSDTAPGGVVKFQALQGSPDLPVAWTVQEQQGGTIDASGNYIAPGVEGTYHIVATARSAGQPAASAQVRVKTRSTQGVALSPHAASVATGGSIAFTVSVTGLASPDVTWSVAEGGAGGTISADGAYVAPQSAGTYHAIATSVADPTKSDTATITVGAPTASTTGNTIPTGTISTTPPTTPPSDGTTAWAPAATDAAWVNVRSYGAVGDAVADDTAAFQKAAATGKKLFIPAPSVAYKITSFITLQNSVYGDGSMPLIRMYGANGDSPQNPTHNIFYISGYQGPGLVINGLHLDGQWDGGTNGEWSHDINVDSSSNVTIQNSTIEGAYGDDIFVGAFAQPMSNNIVIQHNTLGTPRRCNVALDGATNVTITNNTVTKTGSYVAAIDLEPDPLGFQYVRGVTIDSNTFNVAAQEYNGGAISLNNPAGNPASGDVSITNNHGTWSAVAGYEDVISGSGGLVGIVPHLTWDNVTASNNTH